MFYYGAWLKLPISTRVILAKQFGIAKVGSTHVQDNVLVSDGYKVHDVESAITADRIREYLGTDEKDFDTLWSEMVNKAEGRVVLPVGNGMPPPVTFSSSSELTSVVPETVGEVRGQPTSFQENRVPKNKTTRAKTKPRKKGK